MDLPAAAGLAVLEFEDPYASSGYVTPEGHLDTAARLKQARHADGTIAEGAHRDGRRHHGRGSGVS